MGQRESPIGNQSSSLLGRLAANKIALIVWLLILTGTLFGFACHIYYLISRYLEYPVTSVTNQRSTAFIWPDITICPTGRVDFDRIQSHNYTEEYKRWTESFNKYSEFWNKFLITLDLKIPHSNEDGNNLALLNMFWDENESKLGFKQKQDTIFHCEFQEKLCSFVNFTLHKNPSLFNCFTFRPRDRQIGLPGKTYGLKLLMHLGSSNVAWVSSDKQLERFRGFRVAIHQPFTLPDFNKNSFDVSVGTLMDVNLSGQRLKRINRTSRPCYDTQKTWYSDFVGSERYCEEIMLQRHFWQTCGCVSPDLYPLPESAINIEPCTGSRRIKRSLNYDIKTLAKQKAIHFYYNCYIKTSKQLYKLAIGGTDCAMPCIEDTYRILASAIRWPLNGMNAKNAIQQSFEQNINLGEQRFIDRTTLLNWYREFWHIFSEINSENITEKEVKSVRDNYVSSRYAMLKVYVSSTHIDTATEEQAYPTSSLLSDIGGSMGMWVGFSFITVVELVERIIKISMSRWQRRKSLLTDNTSDSPSTSLSDQTLPNYLSTELGMK